MWLGYTALAAPGLTSKIGPAERRCIVVTGPKRSWSVKVQQASTVSAEDKFEGAVAIRVAE